RISPSDIVGNSSGKPPALQTPRLTASATCRRCALQLVSSDHEFAMPITGRPSNTRSLKPSDLRYERFMRPSRFRGANQLRLRSAAEDMRFSSIRSFQRVRCIQAAAPRSCQARAGLTASGSRHTLLCAVNVQRIIRRDRAIAGVGLVGLVLVAWLYLIRMAAQMREMDMAPTMPMPGGSDAGYFILTFLMWAL